MTLADGYSMTDLRQTRRDEVLELDQWAFPSSAPDAALPLPLTWERTHGVMTSPPVQAEELADGKPPTGRGQLVAMHTSYPFSAFPVPGGDVPAAGLSWVGVHPQHRRRGLLSAMIDKHLADCVDRGEVASVLTATEPAIYGRFGYGIATQTLRMTIPRGARLIPVEGADDLTVRIETMDADEHGSLLHDLHRRAGRQPIAGSSINRPGWAARETDELKTVYLSDHPSQRGGREPLRIAIVERDGEPRGYTTLRRKVDWTPAGPRGTVSTGEVVALDPAAAHRLWSTILDLDLTHETVPFMLPVDDAITSLLVDLRAAAPTIVDHVWVRLVDVPRALTARTYASELDVTLRVTDPRLPANDGTWRLTATAFETAEVTSTDRAPDLSLDVKELGGAYLGGTSLAALALAGRVREHTHGALARASTAFGWPVPPACSWNF